MSDEPTQPAAEPMIGRQFVTAHPDLARALARLAVRVPEREIPAAVPRDSRDKVSASDDRG